MTPPDWDRRPENLDSPAQKAYKLRRECWRWFERKVKELQPIDGVIFVGDAIDGKGPRSGGTELLTSDRNEQVDMAAACLAEFKAKSIVMCYGTPYHTGHLEDWEDAVAKHKTLDGIVLKIGGHDYAEVEGVTFDYKHFVSSSSIPHGRHTAVARENLWNALWAEREEYPRADVILRAHVHYYDFCGSLDWLGMTLPGLQAYGSKYGTRKPSGTVDFGFVHFDVKGKDKRPWYPHILRFKKSRPKVIKM